MDNNQNNNGNITVQQTFEQSQNNYQQPINNSYNNFNNTSITNDRKSKNKPGLIILIILIIALGIVAFLYLKKDKEVSNNFDINYATSFFIKDSNNKYALFSEDGKRLTDFIFTFKDDFINGTSLVKKDDYYGIINTNGKMTVDFGKYAYIASAAGMYKVHGEDYHYYLIDGKGKVLYDMENMDLNTFMDTDTHSILEDKNSKTYKVLNYKGKAIITLPIDNSAGDKPSTSESDGYISVFYNNKNYILDVNTGKQIASFDSDKHFCINNVEDGKTFILNSCVSLFQKQDKVYYKLIKDGKLYNLPDECEGVRYTDGILTCSNDLKTYLIDSNSNIDIEISGKAYIDNNTYAEASDKSLDSLDFYNNGNIVKHVECRNLKERGYMKNGLYILRINGSKSCGTEYGMYEYYKSNGENAFGRSFKVAGNFDKNGLAKVSDDKTNYYLIDTSGKQVGGLYSSIDLSNGYYIVTKDDKKGLMDKNGKEIIPCEYKIINLAIKQNKNFATLITFDSKYKIYDIESAREIVTLDSSPILEDHYINIKSNDKTQYYTYSGKMFYETN